MSLQPGQTILNGKYRIERLLGRGAFGEVYLATHLLLNAPVAIKVLRKTAPDVGSTAFDLYRGRFVLEAQLGKRLIHPHVVHADDFIEEAETLYLVMEYLPGGSVKDLLAEQGALPWARAVAILRDASQGLAELHDRLRVVHRDVKPSNILLDATGRAKIADLGLVQTREDFSQRSLLGSQSPPHPGTDYYRSPEHESYAPLQPTSDVYSLGCVAFEMLTGRPWYAVRHQADRVRDLAPETPPWLDDLVARMLCEEPGVRAADAGNPARRFVDCKAVLAALEQGVRAEEERVRLAAQQQRAHAEAERQREIAAAARRRALPWMLGSVALLAVLLAVWRPWAGGAGPAPTPAPVPLLATQPAAHPNPTQSPAAAWTATVTAQPPMLAPSPTLAPTDMPQPTATATPRLTHTPRPTATATPTRSRPTATATPTRPRPTASPTLGIGSTWTSPADGMVQVYVPAGEFLMGSADSDGDASSDEKPQHRVTLSAYWMDRTEVTKDQYQRCVAAGKCAAPSCSGSGQGNHPVVCVAWQDAANYCAWAGRRLPTEAEWEKAARGTDGRIYPWGNQAPDNTRLNFNRDVGKTTAVGAYPAGASPYGALDMAGNVWEWVADWYSETYYASSPAQSPSGPASGQYRVMRGGSWLFELRVVRAANRGRSNPGDGVGNLGFRCARSS